MHRVIAALVALLCVWWGREAHAFIPCETSARWLCSGKCQALAADSPEWAEVQVCGDSPSAAATDAVAELLLQWECAVLDEGDPGPQGGLLGGIDWTNPGGLLGDLMGEFASCVLGNPECSILPTPEQCESGCSYYCMTAGYGYEEHWGTEGLWIWNGIVDVPCPGSAALAEQVVIADQAQRHGVTVTAETCRPRSFRRATKRTPPSPSPTITGTPRSATRSGGFRLGRRAGRRGSPSCTSTSSRAWWSANSERADR